MDWQDPLDFPYQLSSSIHNSSPDQFDRIPILERDYCSNFTCCGLQLSDLHSLLDHFEESHVVVIDNSGSPTFPRNTGWDSSNDSHLLDPQSHLVSYPYTSVAFSYPPVNLNQSDDPYPNLVQAASPLIVASPRPSMHYSQRSFSNEEHTENLDIATTLGAFCIDTDPSFCSPTSEHSSGLPPSSFGKTSRHREPVSTFERRQRKNYKVKTLGQKPRSFPKKRVRAHKCPTVGCSKSYLNPNGLKYHIEKGTCRMVSD